MTIEPVDETIWLAEDLWRDQILKNIERHHPNETGGMLLGYVNKNHRVVTALIDAGPNAQHGPHHMLPDNPYQQAKLLEFFRSTGGRESFLGEWHSHPRGSPEMSPMDRRTLHRVTTKGRHLPALPLMIIAGFEKGLDDYRLRAYRRCSASLLWWPTENHFLEVSIRMYASEK